MSTRTFIAGHIRPMRSNEWEGRMDDPWECPEGVKTSLERYRDHRIPTGGFLHRVLTNDLMGAIGAADDVNIRHLPGIVRWCYDHLPGGSWKTEKAVEAWLAGGDQ